MRKYTIIILITILFLAPVIVRATLPIFVDDGGGGGGGGGGGSGSGSGGTGTGGNTSTDTSSNSDLFVRTTKADSITQSTATLYGEGGYSSLASNLSSNGIWGSTDGGRTGTWSTATDSGTWTASLGTGGTGTTIWTGTGNGTGYWMRSSAFLSENGTWTNGKGTGGTGTGVWSNEAKATTLIPQVTAYFRYAKAKNNHPPIFCNDVYGTNMKATDDIFLKKITTGVLSQSFSQQVTGLSPNTTYYYCAIVSNKDNIAYGGSQIVKEFHTNCYETTVETKSPATNIRSTSASLAGTYCSPKNNLDKTITNDTVTTYFEYRKEIAGGSPQDWITAKVSEQQPYNMGNNANLYGDIKVNLSGLTPETTYQFRAVVKNNAGKSNETIHYGSPSASFTTIPSSGGGTSGCTSCLKPTVTVTADPSSILPSLPGASGESSTIKWESSNATSCRASWTTSTKTSDSEIVRPNKTTNYLITCTGANGTSSGNAYVYVNTNNTLGVDGTCYDGIKNGNETGVDTGGRCDSGWGVNGTCYDGIKNGDETSIDAGGRCDSTTNCLPGSVCYTGGGPGTWTTWDSGTNGNWGTGTDSGTWTATSGTGGGGTVYWAGNGDGTGTWYGTNGSGTWTNGRGTGSAGTGTWTNLALGQTATPPNDAIVRYHEGIETVFTRQIISNQALAQKYGYQAGADLQTFAWNLSDQFARAFGYINSSGKEIRVSLPDVAAYQLLLVGNKLTVYEYYNNRIVDIRNVTTVFKNASGYEYYFKK